MGALGHYLEEEGIPTAQISLVREHTAALNPPRALWVPFMLGRPFGVPGDPAFQRRVLTALLDLLGRESGPVLEDFPEGAPETDPAEDLGGIVCPVSFPRTTSGGTTAERLADEVGQLRAWHEVAVRHRGGTALGVTGLTPNGLADYLAGWLADSPARSFGEGLSPTDALKLACDELRAFYFEAKSVQPGAHSSAEIQRWFWFETSAGRAILDIRAKLAQSADAAAQALAGNSLVPRAVGLALQSGGRA